MFEGHGLEALRTACPVRGGPAAALPRGTPAPLTPPCTLSPRVGCQAPLPLYQQPSCSHCFSYAFTILSHVAAGPCSPPNIVRSDVLASLSRISTARM